MATKDVVVNFEDFTVEGREIDAKKKNAIRIDGLTLDGAKALTYSINEGKLVISNGVNSLKVSNYTGIKYIKTDYAKAGKRTTFNLYDIISENVVDNTTNSITAYNLKKLTATGTNYNDTIDMSTSGYVPIGKNIAKNKGLTVNAGNGNDTVIGTIYNDTIKGGDGKDTITGGKGNDTITGGKGRTNVYHYAGDGDDIVNLTKGEKLYIYMRNSEDETIELTKDDIHFEYTNKNKDLKIYYDKDGVKGSVTLKNFAAKDVLNNATKKTSDTSSVNVNVYGDVFDLKTLLVDTNTGTWRADNIDRSDYKLYKDKQKTIVQDDVTKKGLTIDGKGGNDALTGTNYSDTIKAGTGVDTITGGTGNDNLYGGTSKDSRTTYVFYDGDGNDIVNAGKGKETVLFYNNHYNRLTFTKSGRNLVIGYDMDPEGKTQDSVTIKNYFDKKGNAVSNVKFLKCLEGTFDIETMRSIYNNEGKYIVNTGTDGNDNIVMATFDNINVGDGDDTITVGGSNSTKITIGHGNKTIITPEDFNQRIDIKTAENLTREYYKVDNDLIIKYTTEGWENDSLTIKDYFAKGKYVYPYYNDANVDTELTQNGIIIRGEGLIEGTENTDRIYGSDKEDTIYVNRSDKVYPGKSNDTLIWKKDSTSGGISYAMGQQEVYLKNGDGNNTFIFESQPYSFWQLHFDEDTVLKYERKGNDLLIHSTYNDGTKDITETQTIKDWAVSNYAGRRVLVFQGELGGQDKYTTAYRDDENNGILRVFSNDDTLNKNLYGSDDCDGLRVRGTNINAYGYGGDDSYYLRGTGIVATDTKGNEEYRGYALQNKTTIVDSEGNDSLTFYDENSNGHGNLNDNMDNRQLHLMFNVTKDYKATQGAAAVGDVIVTNDATKENYDLWQADGNFRGISIKNNAIETIKTSDATPYTITNDAVATLAENVAGWLTANDYADVNAVFAKPDNEAGITALIAQFDNAGWTL